MKVAVAVVTQHRNRCKPHVGLARGSAPRRKEMVIRVEVVCDIAPCRLVMSLRRLGGSCCLHLQINPKSGLKRRELVRN